MTTDNDLCRKLGAHYRKEQASRMEQNFPDMNEREARAVYRKNGLRLAAVVVTIALAVMANLLFSEAIAKARHDAAIVRVM